MEQINTKHSKSEMSFETTQVPIFSNGPSSASEHSVYLTYVCLVNHGIPSSSNADKNDNPTDKNAEEESNGDIVEPIQVERSKAVHELVESKKSEDKEYKPATESSEESETSDQDDYNKYDNPKVLKLTKMKWLSEDQNGYPDSSTPSVSSARSTTSSIAEDSDADIVDHQNVGQKCLSTILRLDKEHNLFGMSSIAIIGSKQSRSTKQTRKDDEKPVFHQTAIVQVCCRRSCANACCRYKSNTDLPSSLRFSNCCFSTCNSCCTPPPPPPPRPRPFCYSTCGSIRLGAPVVPPPTCALIPRVPRIHVSCLPDSGPVKKPNCISKCRNPCSPATDPLLCKPCHAQSGSMSRPVGMCTITQDHVCRLATPGECCQSPPPAQPCAPQPPFPCQDECIPDCDVPPCMQQCTCGLTAFVPPEPADCCFGLRLKINRKPVYDPPPIEVTPRCCSDLQKPQMARKCTHNPCCRPPTAAFPYLMPCYWPCRPSAPCLDPLNCFHHPKCLPPYKHKGPIPPDQICPKVCKDPDKKTECQNKSCLGKSKEFQQGLKQWGELGREKGKPKEEKKEDKKGKKGKK